MILGLQMLWLITGPSDVLGRTSSCWACPDVMAAIHVIVMPQWRYRIHRWESTRDAVYIAVRLDHAGATARADLPDPDSRQQARTRSSSCFGLADVMVTTASAAGPLVIHGLDLAVAEALVAELTATAQAAPGDAT